MMTLDEIQKAVGSNLTFVLFSEYERKFSYLIVIDPVLNLYANVCFDNYAQTRTIKQFKELSLKPAKYELEYYKRINLNDKTSSRISSLHFNQ